jgi:predicted dehydrogenase
MIQVAFVGCAHIHTPGYAKRVAERKDVQAKFVWDPDPARAKQRALELHALVVRSRATIWADPEIAAVIICSETNRHLRLVKEGTAARKHLFVEKPLGVGSRDAYAMADLIEQAGILYQTGYGMRSDPKHLFVKQQVDAGNLGKLTRLRASVCHNGSLGGWFDTEWRWMADPRIAGVGAFGDLGTHGLDLLMWLAGDVVRATAEVEVVTRRYGDCDETGEGLLKFSSGAIGTLAAAWVDVANPVSLLVSGTEGHAAIVGGKVYFQSSKVPGADGKQPWTALLAALPSPLDMFLSAVGGATGLPLVGVREAAKRSAVMEAMYKGAKSQRWMAPK